MTMATLAPVLDPPRPGTTLPRDAAVCLAPHDDRHWPKLLGRYREPNLARSLAELAWTAAPFAALWWLMWLSLGYAYWLCLLLAVPAAGFLVRLFMIQHDCGHGSFFPQRSANDWLGRAIGVLTLTPYRYWQRCHAVHHASSANLDQRGIGDVPTLTVAEYLGRSRWRRAGYRIARNPLILLGIAPFLLFVVKHRLPMELIDGGRDVWVSALATNLAIAGAVLGVGSVIGFDSVLLVQLPITILASSIGVWLFYVQHQFEDTWWADDKDWTFHAGAMRGSSHLDLPRPLSWLTANIGIHHVHHLVSRIPSYRLGEVLRDHAELRGMGRITLRDSLRCFRLTLWDEEAQRLIGFGDLRRRAAALSVPSPA